MKRNGGMITTLNVQKIPSLENTCRLARLRRSSRRTPWSRTFVSTAIHTGNKLFRIFLITDAYSFITIKTCRSVTKATNCAGIFFHFLQQAHCRHCRPLEGSRRGVGEPYRDGDGELRTAMLKHQGLQSSPQRNQRKRIASRLSSMSTLHL